MHAELGYSQSKFQVLKQLGLVALVVSKIDVVSIEVEVVSLIVSALKVVTSLVIDVMLVVDAILVVDVTVATDEVTELHTMSILMLLKPLSLYI